MSAGLVYDVHTREGGWPNTEAWRLAFADWLNAHGVDENITTRVEFHVIDAPLIRVFRMARGDDGRIYLDPVTGTAAQRPPFDVLIRTPAPRPEDYA